MSKIPNICFFFGTFNPIGSHHIIFAEAVHDKGYHVQFVPAYQPPHKINDQDVSSFTHRSNMVDLAIQNKPYFSLSRIEETLPTPSFSVDTLRALIPGFDRKRKRIPFMSGSDEIIALPHWRSPLILAKKLLVLASQRKNQTIPKSLSLEGKETPLKVLPIELPLFIPSCPIPLQDLSATLIRQRIASGQSLKGLLPSEDIEHYIQDNGLYKDLPSQDLAS